MNAVEIFESEALSAGADLWIIKNDSKNKWWQELDFKSGFLLSQCLYHNKKIMATKLTELLQQTEMQKYSFTEDLNILLVGTSGHFLNKWILLWNDHPEEVVNKLEEMTKSLKLNSIRFFSDSKKIMHLIESRQKTSLNHIAFIENT